MSQAHVEHVIGRLVTDEHWRARFRSDPTLALDALTDSLAFELTTTERRALLTTSPDALDGFARVLDPRLQRLGGSR